VSVPRGGQHQSRGLWLRVIESSRCGSWTARCWHSVTPNEFPIPASRTELPQSRCRERGPHPPDLRGDGRGGGHRGQHRLGDNRTGACSRLTTFVNGRPRRGRTPRPRQPRCSLIAVAATTGGRENRRAYAGPARFDGEGSWSRGRRRLQARSPARHSCTPETDNGRGRSSTPSAGRGYKRHDVRDAGLPPGPGFRWIIRLGGQRRIGHRRRIRRVSAVCPRSGGGTDSGTATGSFAGSTRRRHVLRVEHGRLRGRPPHPWFARRR